METSEIETPDLKNRKAARLQKVIFNQETFIEKQAELVQLKKEELADLQRKCDHELTHIVSQEIHNVETMEWDIRVMCEKCGKVEQLRKVDISKNVAKDPAKPKSKDYDPCEDQALIDCLSLSHSHKTGLPENPICTLCLKSMTENKGEAGRAMSMKADENNPSMFSHATWSCICGKQHITRLVEGD